jgi:hypothetical protein
VPGGGFFGYYILFSPRIKPMFLWKDSTIAVDKCNYVV